MRRLFVLIFILIIFTSAVAFACDDSKVDKFISISWTRCINPQVAIKFEDCNTKEEIFVVLSRDDAIRLQKALNR